MTEKTAARLEGLRKRKAQLENRIAAAEQEAKAAARKLDARRKIVVGGAILAAIADSPGLAEMVKTVLAQRVTRALDRAAVADLLDAPAIKPKPAPGPE
jgi:septal ring factor EnvC (AmiA/AmiB activator)